MNGFVLVNFEAKRVIHHNSVETRERVLQLPFLSVFNCIYNNDVTSFLHLSRCIFVLFFASRLMLENTIFCPIDITRIESLGNYNESHKATYFPFFSLSLLSFPIFFSFWDAIKNWVMYWWTLKVIGARVVSSMYTDTIYPFPAVFATCHWKAYREEGTGAGGGGGGGVAPARTLSFSFAKAFFVAGGGGGVVYKVIPLLTSWPSPFFSFFLSFRSCLIFGGIRHTLFSFNFWAPFHKTFHQWQMTVFVISYWNPCFWLVISRFVTDFCHLSLKKGFVKRVPGVALLLLPFDGDDEGFLRDWRHHQSWLVI